MYGTTSNLLASLKTQENDKKDSSQTNSKKNFLNPFWKADTFTRNTRFINKRSIVEVTTLLLSLSDYVILKPGGVVLLMSVFF